MINIGVVSSTFFRKGVYGVQQIFKNFPKIKRKFKFIQKAKLQKWRRVKG